MCYWINDPKVKHNMVYYIFNEYIWHIWMQSIISISSHRRTFGNVNLIQTRIKIYVQLCHSDYYRLRDLVTGDLTSPERKIIVNVIYRNRIRGGWNSNKTNSLRSTWLMTDWVLNIRELRNFFSRNKILERYQSQDDVIMIMNCWIVID